MPPERESASATTRRKPGRAPTSCAECRRLKLKCDRKFPCEKCVTRGCASICPEATLAPRKGHRLVLSSTTDLYDRIDTLCVRIRELEDALRLFQDSHPLLNQENLSIKYPRHPREPDGVPPVEDGIDYSTTTGSSKTTLTETEMIRGECEYMKGSLPQPESNSPPASGVDETEEELSNVFGTLTLGSFGESAFLGRTARAEYLIRAMSKSEAVLEAIPAHTDLSSSVINASCSSNDGSNPDPTIVREVYSKLPPLSEATRLCDSYLKAGEWLFMAPLQRAEVYDDIIATIYAREHGDQAQNPHMLALLFSILAIGALYDETLPSFSSQSLQFFYCARAALSFISRTKFATLESVMILSHMSQFGYLYDWESLPSADSWGYLGFAERLATSIGLHLNSERWNFPAPQVQKRSRIFWSLFTFDIHHSFGLGRPPGLSPAFVDCALPNDLEVTLPSGKQEPSFHAWGIKYSLLLYTVMASAFGKNIPQYPTIIDLDRQIRDFPIPEHLRLDCKAMNGSSDHLMKQYWIVGYKEAALLNLHRSHFTLALKEMPEDPLKHKYAASVMATYRSAWRMIEGLKLHWDHATRRLLERVSLPWSLALSGTIVLCLLVTRAPGSSLTKSALDTLDCAESLFKTAALTCRAAANNLESVQKIRAKAYSTALSLATAPDEVLLHELDRLGGKTHLFISPQDTSHSSPPAPSLSSPSSPPSVVGSSPSPPYISQITNMDNTSDSSLEDIFSQSFPPIFPFNFGNVESTTDAPANLESMHPTIVQDMHDMTAAQFAIVPGVTPNPFQDAGVNNTSIFEGLDFDYNSFQLALQKAHEGGQWDTFGMA